ncbi:guanine nucleotide exchange factor [Radiomyces spectabilis]|uniref:guanine nucleotide exchange factor n=1 Tax=Radiomyces spectabilis TaxID=64574 RepID=UPI00221EF2F8|nr:guanine nucleotide exchange factor [Radiomyces spectabilis]KAI8393971.1 guanine nucleotide exchange factor [Radiomyces spectabilis]
MASFIVLMYLVLVTLHALQIVKLLGRTVEGSDALFANTGLRILADKGGLTSTTTLTDTPTSQEALKCIANCILLKPTVKNYLEELGAVETCCRLLQLAQPSMDTQFLSCRILFFMTVDRNDLVDQLIQQEIASGIQKVLSKNVSLLKSQAPSNVNAPINALTVSGEALKLLFNLMLLKIRNAPDNKDAVAVAEHFEACLMPIYEILFSLPFPEPLPLSAPHSHAIHALMQFPYSVSSSVWVQHPDFVASLGVKPEEAGDYIVNKFIGALDKSIRYLLPNGGPDEDPKAVQEHTTDAVLAPLILTLRVLADGDINLRRSMGKQLLPKDSDRLLPVNQGQSLSAYMIRCSTSTMLPQTRDAVCELLFILCDENPTQFTQQVGYGNAIGFLVNRGIPMEPPQEAAGDEKDKEVNPITGQYISAENNGPSLADMTDEEKEREAERLFVLFERLKKTGVIDVENPIATAMRENRFHEVDSTDSDGSDSA